MSHAVARVQPDERTLPSPTVVVFSTILLATIGAIAWTVSALTDPTALPIRRVQVEGEFVHLDPAHLQDVVAAVVDAGFFRVDVARVRERLLEEPWIRDATIRRVWPESLRVSIVEQRAVARWGERSLLNEGGELFTPAPAALPAGLVQLGGPPGAEREVLEAYRRMAARLDSVGLAIETLELSARHAWRLRLVGGTELALGRRDVEMRLERFLAAWHQGLGDVWERVGRVDLRYTNGFAVGARVVPPEPRVPGGNS
ncbi:MAG: cell division protein FtsQ/DivIB [Gammaproteobacteria bacterium]